MGRQIESGLVVASGGGGEGQETGMRASGEGQSCYRKYGLWDSCTTLSIKLSTLNW